MRSLALVLIAACGGGLQNAAIVALRPACADGEFWTGTACKRGGDAPQKLAAGMQALAAQDLDAAKVDLDAVAKGGPLDHATNVTWWEQRGIAAAYVDDEAGAKRAFDMMLALDPGHFLSYTLSPKATFVFEQVRRAQTAPPALDVNWTRGGKVGEPVPLDIEVLSDPKRFLDHATVFVHARGEPAWRAADVKLDAADKHIVLPPVGATQPISLELYVRAYDAGGNEVLTWADAKRPREIALRYEPATPWYRKWWVWAIAGSAVAIATGVTVYETTLGMPDTIGNVNVSARLR